MTGAASELESIPFVGPEMGAKLQRTLRGINAAQFSVDQVVAGYSQAASAAGQIQQRFGLLREQTAKASAAINRIGGQARNT